MSVIKTVLCDEGVSQIRRVTLWKGRRTENRLPESNRQKLTPAYPRQSSTYISNNLQAARMSYHTAMALSCVDWHCVVGELVARDPRTCGASTSKGVTHRGPKPRMDRCISGLSGLCYLCCLASYRPPDLYE